MLAAELAGSSSNATPQEEEIAGGGSRDHTPGPAAAAESFDIAEVVKDIKKLFALWYKIHEKHPAMQGVLHIEFPDGRMQTDARCERCFSTRP